MIALFLFTDLYALAWAALYALAGAAPQSILDAGTIGWVLCMAPPMLLGITIGRRAFDRVSPAQFQRWVLNLLVVVCCLSVAVTLRSTAT